MTDIQTLAEAVRRAHAAYRRSGTEADELRLERARRRLVEAELAQTRAAAFRAASPMTRRMIEETAR